MKQSNLFGGSEPAIASTINYLEAEWTVIENNTDQKKTKIARTIGDEKSVRWVDWDAIGFTPDEPEPDESEPPTKSDDKPAYTVDDTLMIGNAEAIIKAVNHKRLTVIVPALSMEIMFNINTDEIPGVKAITFAKDAVIKNNAEDYFAIESVNDCFAIVRDVETLERRGITSGDAYTVVPLNLAKILRDGMELRKQQKSEQVPTATLEKIADHIRGVFEEEEINAPLDEMVRRLISDNTEKSLRMTKLQNDLDAQTRRASSPATGNYDERDDKIKGLTRQIEQLKKTNQQQSQMLIAQVGASSANEFECDFVINQNAEKHAEMLNDGWEVEHMQFIPSGTPTRPMMCVTYKRRKATQKSIAPATGAITINPIPAFEEAVLNRKSTAQDIINAGNGQIMAIGRDAFNS